MDRAAASTLINMRRQATTKNHPLGSMPRRLSSSLATCLNQLPSVVWSLAASRSSCSLSSGLMRIWKVGDLPPVLGVRSLTLDIVRTFQFNKDLKVRTLYNKELENKRLCKVLAIPRKA